MPYLDRLTGKQIAPVTTGQIYWGAVPFVCIQVIMIGLTIAFPQMVMHYKGTAVDPGTIEIQAAGHAWSVAARHAAGGWRRPGQWRRRTGGTCQRPVATTELRRHSARQAGAAGN